MCDKSFMLIVFLFIKIVILVITPLFVYFLYKKESKIYNLIGGLDAFFIFLFIILKLVGNPCITNSTFSYINKTRKGTITEKSDDLYTTVLSTKKYTLNNAKDAYYYSIDSDPLRNVKLSCGRPSYMKNYGDSISAITTLIANYYGVEINEMEIINYLDENKLIDCEKGVDFDTVIKKLESRYYYKTYQITKSEVYNYVSNGKSVLVETKNNYKEKKNFGCEKDYIVIYNINNDGYYNIINPNDKDHEYFCPSNTIGYGSIIEDNQNNKIYTLDEIDSKALRYFVIEVIK